MSVALNEEETFRRFLSEIDAAAIENEGALPFWREACKQIQHDARRGNKLEFLRWPGLNNFSVPDSWVPDFCYTSLRTSQDWALRWLPLTRETWVGRPKNLSQDPGSSPILIQHAYHLFRYEALTAHSLVDCEVIFEVGGGYGSFCRLLKNARFNGLHIIYDLPHVTAIQRLYLALSGLDDVSQAAMSRRDRHGFYLISDAALDKTFEALVTSKLRVGLVATWSLSEFPLAARTKVLPRFLEICSRVLIAYQPEFMGINNLEYFEMVRRQRPQYAWKSEGVWPSYYMFA